MTPEQEKLDRELWWTTVRPWLAQLPPSWPSQHTTRKHMRSWTAGKDTHTGEENELEPRTHSIYIRHRVGRCPICGSPILDNGQVDDPELWEHAWTPPNPRP